MVINIIFIIASVLGVINLINATSVPFITPCKSVDEECAKKNAVAAIPILAGGVPEFGVDVMDPLYIKHVDSSSPNLKFLLNDLTLIGLKTCQPNAVKHDHPNLKLYIQLQCDLVLDGNYEMAGKILVLDINGKGKIHVILRKLLINLDLDVTQKDGKDGEKHYHIKKFKHSYNFKDKPDVVFEGLFENNDVLSKAADELIKNNSDVVVHEIGVQMFQKVITTVIENINNMLRKVAVKELTLD